MLDLLSVSLPVGTAELQMHKGQGFCSGQISLILGAGAQGSREWKLSLLFVQPAVHKASPVG